MLFVCFFLDFGVWLYQVFDEEQLLAHSAAQFSLHH